MRTLSLCFPFFDFCFRAFFLALCLIDSRQTGPWTKGAWPTHTQTAGFIFYASVEQTAAPEKGVPPPSPSTNSAASSIADGRKESRKIGKKVADARRKFILLTRSPMVISNVSFLFTFYYLGNQLVMLF